MESLEKNCLSYKGFARRLAWVWIAALVALAGGCAGNKEPLEITEVEEIEAEVTAVDVSRRLVSLRGPDGNELTIQAGPEVRNLAQIRVGDRLSVSYTRAFIASMTEEGQPASEGTVAIGAVRAEEGERPGAAVGGMISATVEIISIGEDGTSVTFRGPTGDLRSMDVLREEARAFVRKLKLGDMVDLTYAEAIAIEIKPAD